MRAQHSGPERCPNANQKVANSKNRKTVVMSKVVYTDSDLKVEIGIEEAAIPGTSTIPAPSLEDNVNVKHEEN